MTPERWRSIEALFTQVANLPPGGRESLLSAAEPSIREEVERMLAAESQRTGTFQSAVRSVVQTLRPDRIGAWRIIGLIGQGGMGAVYRAARDDQAFEKQVAIKIMHGGVDTARFRQERTILAALEHPNIARLLDGGETDDGVSYIVLEYVDGLPLTEYCGRQGLSRNDRLRLFLEICAAVQYAHRNLIVHRDLKPSNILVTKEGTPKLLDFGIAKLLDAERTSTATGSQALTPQYASPEQVRGGAITTATDVYSLGVILYELLTGKRPYEFPTPLTASSIEHIVCMVEPAPPGVSEDLDNILLLALRKEPGRRYLSVREFADDIERSLSDVPVLARPDTLRYRATKFVRRNRLSLAAGMLTLAAVLTASGVAIYQARVAQHQAVVARERFQQLRTLAHTFVFDLHDEIAKLDGSTQAREMMVRTALGYLDRLSKGAGDDLDLQREIAAAYVKVADAQGHPTRPNLGRTADSLASYRKAGDIYRRIADRDPAYLHDLATYYRDLAYVVRLTNDRVQARALSELALATMDRVRSAQPADRELEQHYADSWCNLGEIDEDMGEFQQAMREFSRCGELARALLNTRKDRASLLGVQAAVERIGTAAQELGLFTEAERAFDENDAILAELLVLEPRNPVFHRRQALGHQFRSILYHDDMFPELGDSARALASAQRYLDGMREMTRRDLSNTSAQISVAIALSRVSYSMSEFDANRAIDLARESVRMFDEMITAGKGNYLITANRATSLRRLVYALSKGGRAVEARTLADEAITELRKVTETSAAGSTDRMELVQGLISAGEAQAAAGNPGRAEGLPKEARTMAQIIAQRAALANVVPQAHVEASLGGFYIRQRRKEEARASFERLVQLWGRFPASNQYVDRQKATALRLLASVR